jgi:hypothetical protein
MSAFADTGPRVAVKVLAGGSVITRGEREAGWGADATVTVPVRPVRRTVADANVCIAFGPAVEPIRILVALLQASGVPPQLPPQNSGRGQKGQLRLEYLRSGHTSWWSLAHSVARRMGLGHAPAGTWIVLLLVGLAIVIVTLASWLAFRELTGGRQGAVETGRMARRLPGVLRRIPRAAWICALIACLNAICWSLITPPFQAPDEPSHFAYAQQLAETGTLPTGSTDYSEEERVAIADLRAREVRFHPEEHTIATVSEQRRLEDDLAQPLERAGSGADVAANQPPLYYALQTIPYRLGSSGSLLDRLELMRLLSALFGGVTALFVYLFVREALLGAPWAWVVGGLGVALAPLLGFMSGVINPDSMLATVSAAIFYCLARGFRRGLTTRLALAIGALTCIGFLTKLNFIALAPGVFLGLVALTLRRPRSSRRAAYGALAGAVAIAAVPVCVYVLNNLLSSHHPTLGMVSAYIANARGSVFGEISYIWQSYLPRLPGMSHDFPGLSTTRQMWFDRWVGNYGWLDTSFPPWVDRTALIPASLLTILGIRALVVLRATLRRRFVELAVYAVMGVGLLAVIGASSYLLTEEAGIYSEPRYLLPLLALLGAALVLSARGAGRRWGPPAGALIVVLFLAHNLFSQLQVIARFYG